FHGSDVEAVAAALRTTFYTVPAEELPRYLTQGHPLSRAAALIHGGNRLGAEDLQLLLPLAEDPDPIIRRATLRALGEVADPRSWARLEQAIRSEDPLEAGTAVAALADSRFTASRERLRTLLETEEPRVRDRILHQLTSQPRP